MLLNNKEVNSLKNFVYSTISEAKIEIEKRQKDEKLKKKVKDFFGIYNFPYLEDKPKAVLSRSIFTPNLEFDYYIDLIKTIKLEPLLLEYDGKFVAKNSEKYHLCKLYFQHTKPAKSINYSTMRIVDFNIYEGERMKDVKTIWDTSLTDFHRYILKQQHPEINQKETVIDFYDWFNQTRFLTDNYYFYFLSLFICNGVLFENFLINDNEEAKFIKDHLLNSFSAVNDYFGVKPLVCPLLPLENEKSKNWLSYKSTIKNNIEQYIIDNKHGL